MQTIVYQCDTAMPAQKLPNCCNNKCYRQGGQSSSRFLLVVRELWGSITTEAQAEICRRMTDGRWFV